MLTDVNKTASNWIDMQPVRGTNPPPLLQTESLPREYPTFSSFTKFCDWLGCHANYVRMTPHPYVKQIYLWSELWVMLCQARSDPKLIPRHVPMTVVWGLSKLGSLSWLSKVADFFLFLLFFFNTCTFCNAQGLFQGHPPLLPSWLDVLTKYRIHSKTATTALRTEKNTVASYSLPKHTNTLWKK